MPAANFARQLSATRYFPDPPGIGGQWLQPILNPGAALYKVKKIRENLRFLGFSLIIYMVLVHSVMRMPGISQMQ